MDAFHCPVCGQMVAVKTQETRGFWHVVTFSCPSCGEQGEDYLPVASAMVVAAPQKAPEPVVASEPVKKVKKSKPARSPRQPRQRASKKTPEKPKRQRQAKKVDRLASACREYRDACEAHHALLQKRCPENKAARRRALEVVVAAYQRREQLMGVRA